MRIEIVLHQSDEAGIGKVDIRQLLQNVGIINGGMMIRDFDAPPAFKRREQHEHVGRADALVFVIVTHRLSPLDRDRRSRFPDELFGRFIETD